MTAFLVKLPENRQGLTLVDGITAVLVEASTEEQAVSMAKTAVGGDPNSIWDMADVIEAGQGGDPADFDFHLAVSAPGVDVPLFDSTFVADANYSITSFLLNDGGANYVANDLLTVAGTGSPDAVFKVLSIDEGTGAITDIAQVTPGQYTVDVSGTAVELVGGSGTGGLINVQSVVGSFEGLLAQALAALVDTATFANAELDLNARVLLIAPDTDSLGDHFIQAEFFGLDRNGSTSDVPVESLIDSLTHNNEVAATDLAVVLVAAVDFTVPLLIDVLKS